jgi:hypothetical protein
VYVVLVFPIEGCEGCRKDTQGGPSTTEAHSRSRLTDTSKHPTGQELVLLVGWHPMVVLVVPFILDVLLQL